jgi:hypothetical protein
MRTDLPKNTAKAVQGAVIRFATRYADWVELLKRFIGLWVGAKVESVYRMPPMRHKQEQEKQRKRSKL